MEWNFGENHVVEESTLLSKVPENLRGAYVPITEGDNKGKFGISEVALPLVSSIDGFAKSLRTAREERDAVRGSQNTTLEPWLKLGKTAEEVGTKIAGLEKQLAERGQVDIEALRRDAAEAAQGVVKEKDEEIARKDTALSKYMVESAAKSALAEFKGSEALLMPHILAQCKVVRGDGDEYLVHVVDKDGNARGDGAGGFLTIRGLVEGLKKDQQFGVAFQSDQQLGGAGTRTVLRQPSGAVISQATQTDVHGTSRIAKGLAARR